MKILTLLQLSIIFVNLISSSSAKTPPIGLIQKRFPQSTTISWKKFQIKAYIAANDRLRTLGLSGISSGDLGPKDGVIFLFKQKQPRSFWMPDTYFDLAIIFLDKNLKIVHLEKRVPHHPGRQGPMPIARTPLIQCTNVLELKASSPVVKDLKIGDQFTWMGPPSRALLRIE